MKKYFGDILDGFLSVWQGMQLTLKHLVQSRHMHAPTNVQHTDYFKQNTGIVTLQYPFEAIPVPDHGRYRLHNEMDDCIVCDKCAVICPVNCIDIVPIKSPEPIGETSDGSVKRLYAAKFDIDMAKCCFCGLCTSVCPTECLTMTKTYDFSEYDVRNMNYHFANISPKVAEEKKVVYDQFIKEKEALKNASKAVVTSEVDVKVESAPKPIVIKPAFKPVIKKPDSPTPEV